VPHRSGTALRDREIALSMSPAALIDWFHQTNLVRADA
jgi:hypothetical protein